MREKEKKKQSLRTPVYERISEWGVRVVPDSRAGDLGLGGGGVGADRTQLCTVCVCVCERHSLERTGPWIW